MVARPAEYEGITTLRSSEQVISFTSKAFQVADLQGWGEWKGEGGSEENPGRIQRLTGAFITDNATVTGRPREGRGITGSGR